MQDISHAGRLGNILTLNGNFRQDFPVLSGQRLRLRLINAANARVMGISFDGHDPLAVALDEQPVDRPFAPARNTILLAPAQRADLILDCTKDPGTKSEIVAHAGRERLTAGWLVSDEKRRQRQNVLADSPVLQPSETVTIAFKAHNPGK